LVVVAVRWRWAVLRAALPMGAPDSRHNGRQIIAAHPGRIVFFKSLLALGSSFQNKGMACSRT
jgi:hypothetical protein